MLVRIVKMGFQSDKIETFLQNFEENRDKIRNFEGCQFLELYREKGNTNRFFTYSYWENEDKLENYRRSELFKNVWANTKILFSEKPEAWSLEKEWSSK